MDVSAQTFTVGTQAGVYFGTFFCMNASWARWTRMTDRGRPSNSGRISPRTPSRYAEKAPSAGTLSVADAVVAMGVGAGLLWDAVHERRLRVVRCGGELRFRTADLEAWIEGQRAPVRRRESRSVPVAADAGEELLTIDQGAARVGVGAATLWRWLNDTEVPFVLAPGSRGHRDVRHVRVRDLDQLADRRRDRSLGPGVGTVDASERGRASS